MKHLLAALSTAKLQLDYDESEVKKLLSDVQKLRKDTKSSESWEDTLEKVLEELRSTEYAVAFLRPVRKAEAWDYETIIKNPMDLQTMGKKVKSHQYASKKQFADDLNLIWENCLTYNTDPSHPLRRAAVYMRRKSDQILRRIPDRNERFEPRLIDNLKLAPKSSKLSSPGSALTNGVICSTPLQNGGILGSVASAPPTTAINSPETPSGMVNGHTRMSPSSSMSSSHVKPGIGVSSSLSNTDIPFEEQPALERNTDGMDLFISIDAQINALLASLDTPGASCSTVAAVSPDNNERQSDVTQQLQQILEQDDELPCWNGIPDEPNSKERLPLTNGRNSSPDIEMMSPSHCSTTSENTKKRKRQPAMFTPRKRLRLENLSLPARHPAELWWQAVGSTTLLPNAIPEDTISQPPQNPMMMKHKARLRSTSLANESPMEISEQRDRMKPVKNKHSLNRLMSKNIATRKRARALTILISDQIEEQKQAIDPDDVTVVPREVETSTRRRQTWANRVGLAQRRREEHVTMEIGAEQAQGCMEWMATTVLEHSNFDSSSKMAIQMLADIAGKCVSNVGRTMKVMQEAYGKTMSGEEMVLHSLYSSGIGSVHELEAYIKADIIKHGSNLQTIFQTLDETEVRKDEVMDEDTLLDGDGEEVMTGLGELGEDMFGFRELGLEAEFGLKSLTVPKRLWRPKAKAVSDKGKPVTEDVKFPPPPPFIPLETNRIERQIGLLRPYYQERIAALIPPPRLPTPPPVATPQPKPPTPVEPIVDLPLPPPPPPPPPPPAAAVDPTPAPEFDPYNPSALSIVVRPSHTTSAPAAAPTPTPAPVSSITKSPPALIIHPPISNYQTDIPGIPPQTHLFDEFEHMPDGLMFPVPVPPTLLIEAPPILEDDSPDLSRVKVGPLGQIQVPSASSVAKQKRQNKAAMAKSKAPPVAASTPTTTVPSSPLAFQSKPKKVSPTKKGKKGEPLPQAVST